MRAEDVMQRDVITVGPDLPVSKFEGHLHRVLVVDDDSVVGILTALDLLQVLISD